jgi:Zn-dependent protease
MIIALFPILLIQFPQTAGEWIHIAQFFIVFYFSISFHECAHAWAAYRNGDDTARLMGRMTLNPIPHLDPVGTVVLPLFMLFSSFRLLGWAKPVPVNPLHFRNYRRGEIETSLAGPVSNLLLAVGSVLLLRVLLRFLPTWDVAIGFLATAAFLNVALCIFNLVPIYPLDGSHILKNFLSKQAAEAYDRYITPYGWFILLGLVYSGLFGVVFSVGNLFLRYVGGLPTF